MLRRSIFSLFLLLLIFNPANVTAKQQLWFYVVDRSGSIGEYELKEPITRRIIENLSERTIDDEVRLVFFNERLSHPWIRKSVSHQEKVEFEEFFRDSFQPQGNTHLYDAAADVFAEVNSEATDYENVSIMIFSDGEDSGTGVHQGWDTVDELVQSIEQQIGSTKCFVRWYTYGFIPAPENCPQSFSYTSVDTAIMQLPPEARFEVVPSRIQVGQEVFFNQMAAAGGPIESCRWLFGDGQQAELLGRNLDVGHTYSTSGSYDVTLVVFGPGGTDTLTISDAVSAEETQLIADFRFVPASPSVGTEVVFINTSQGDVSQYDWTIEGHSSNNRDFEYVFENAGSYSVRLEVAGGGTVNSTTQVIQVQPPPPDPTFTCDPLVVFTLGVDEQIELKASDRAEGVQHEWLLPKGVTHQGPVTQVTPTEVGPYTITHVVRSEGGIDQRSHTIPVILPNEPNPDFTINRTLVSIGAPEAGNAFICNAKDTRTGLEHTWRVIGSEVIGRGHKFEWKPSIAGDFVIEHTIRRTIDGMQKVAPLPVSVRHLGAILVRFDIDKDSGRAPHEVKFTDESESEVPVVSYHWDFGDGNTSDYRNPAHTYIAPGTYTVTLMASNGIQTYSNPDRREIVVIPPFNWKPVIAILILILLLGIVILLLMLRPPALNGSVTWSDNGSGASGEIYLSGRGKCDLVKAVNEEWTGESDAWAPDEGLQLCRERSKAYYWYRDGVQDRLVQLPQDQYEHEGIAFTYSNDMDEPVDPDADDEEDFA